jgi:hypothetical protein
VTEAPGEEMLVPLFRPTETATLEAEALSLNHPR